MCIELLGILSVFTLHSRITCTLYLYIDNFILDKDHRNKVFKAKENIVFFSNSTLFHVTKVLH